MTLRGTRAKTAQGRMDHFDAIRFTAYLGAQSAEIGKGRRGDKTRLKLLTSGTLLLESAGFRELNVEDVCKAAGMAKGTFYIYFASKDDYLVELCRRYVQYEVGTIPIRRSDLKDFAQFHLWTLWYERTFALNAGVIRCLVQMSEVNADARELWHERNRLIVDRFLTELFPACPREGPVHDLARLAFRTAGGMIDQSLFERHRIQIGPGRQEPDDNELLLELHTLLMYRAVLGRDPPADELTGTLPLLQWSAMAAS